MIDRLELGMFPVALAVQFSGFAEGEATGCRFGARRLVAVFPCEETARQGIVGDDADALIDSLEQLLSKKRQIKQGAVQELLTGKMRLRGFESRLGYK